MHMVIHMDAIETSATLLRTDLVNAARVAAWLEFSGRKELTDEIVRRATSAGFQAITATDRLAGTSTHPVAAYAHGVQALAVEGVEAARAMWATQRARINAPLILPSLPAKGPSVTCIPTIHMNGSDGAHLLDLHEQALATLRELEGKLELCAPNARDFYVQPDPGAATKASAEHRARLATLAKLRAELGAIRDGIADQMEERARRRAR